MILFRWLKSGGWIPVFIFLFSFFLRMALISKGPYNVDGLCLAVGAGETLRSGQLQPMLGTGYPLTVVLGAMFAALMGAGNLDGLVLAVNMMSVVFGALSVVALYALAKELCDRTTAVFSAVLLSISPIFLGVSVYGMSHSPSLFFLLWGAAGLVRAGKDHDRRRLVGAAVCLGLGGAARFQDWVLILAPCAAWIILHAFTGDRGKQRRAWLDTGQTLALFFGVSALVVLLFHLPFGLQPGPEYSGQLRWFISEALVRNFKGVISDRLPAAVAFLRDNSSTAGLLSAAAGLVLLWRRQIGAGVFLSLWLAIPGLFYGNLHYMVNPRFLVVLLPSLVIFQGYFLAFLVRRGRFHTVGAAAIVVMAVIAALPIYPLLKFRHDHAVLPDFVRWVERRTPGNSVIIVADEELFFRYYTRREVVKRPCAIQYAAPERLAVFERQINAFLDQDVPVYITTAGLYAYDRDGHFSKFFKSRYDGVLLGTHLYEDWHQGSQADQVFPCDLYRVKRLVEVGDHTMERE